MKKKNSKIEMQTSFEMHTKHTHTTKQQNNDTMFYQDENQNKNKKKISNHSQCVSVYENNR